MDDSKTFWMDEQTRLKYQVIRKELKTLRLEHRELMTKFNNKTSTKEEQKRMGEIIKRINELEDERRKIDKQNPIIKG